MAARLKHVHTAYIQHNIEWGFWQGYTRDLAAYTRVGLQQCDHCSFVQLPCQHDGCIATLYERTRRGTHHEGFVYYILHMKPSYHTARGLTSSFALTSTRGWARRRGTTDARPLIAAQCRGVQPPYRDRWSRRRREECKEIQQGRSRCEGTQEEERGHHW